MNLKLAQRTLAKIKMGLQGPSGSGKTYSSLLIAYGLCNDWSKVALVDSENHSAELYSHMGGFNVVNLQSPFTPEKYIEAISLCENAGMAVIIIDSTTHSWENLLDFHASLQGNSFTNWSKITPRHNAFVQKILQSPCHVISTVRTKQDYVLNEKNGKMVPQKVGLKSIQRDNLEYEFTLAFDLDMSNHATCSKDRTGLFFGKPEHKLSVDTGKQIKEWCNAGVDVSSQDIMQRINDCLTLNELFTLYKEYPLFKESLKPEYEQRKRTLMINADVTKTLSHSKIPNNGTVQ